MHTLRLYRFRYFDPLRRRWMMARFDDLRDSPETVPTRDKQGINTARGGLICAPVRVYGSLLAALCVVNLRDARPFRVP